MDDPTFALLAFFAAKNIYTFLHFSTSTRLKLFRVKVFTRHAVKSALSSRTRARAPGRSNRDSLRIPVGLTTRVRVRARGLGVVHNSRIGTFANAGSGVFLVGHVMAPFWGFC